MATTEMNTMSGRTRRAVDFGQILDCKANLGTEDIVDVQNMKDSVVQICDCLGLHKRARIQLHWLAGVDGAPGIPGDIADNGGALHSAANRDFCIVGTNATSALCTFDAEGGLVLTTAAAGSDEEILTAHTTAKVSGWYGITWGTDRETRFECDIVSGATITAAEHVAGLSLLATMDVATDADFVKFWHGSGDANWSLAYDIAGADPIVEIDTGVAFAASTRYHMIIDIDADRVARGYINGVHVATTPALTDAINLLPFVGVGDDASSAAKAMTVYSISMSRLYGA